MSESGNRVKFCWPGALAAAALLFLAAMSLGTMQAALRLEFKLPGANGQALSLDPGQEKSVNIPPDSRFSEVASGRPGSLALPSRGRETLLLKGERPGV